MKPYGTTRTEIAACRYGCCRCKANLGYKLRGRIPKTQGNLAIKRSQRKRSRQQAQKEMED